jgi:hypothetical protein
VTAAATVGVRYPYRPHTRQQAFHASRAEEILYGGSAGGGKTDALIAAGVRLCVSVAGASVILFRRSYPEMEQLIVPRMLQRLGGIARYRGNLHVFEFPNGSLFRLGYLQSENDVTRYQGPEYQLILYDELTHFSRRQYTYMRSRLRSAGAVRDAMDVAGLKPRMMSATNPGGPGHGWVKRMFIDPSVGLPQDALFLGGIEEEQDEQGLLTLAFIPAKATDNPYLDQDDYQRKLSALDPILARALRDGDWDILEGVRFPQFRQALHVIRPEQLPLSLVGYPRAVGVDYGLTAPFCALWGARVGDTVVIYRELYARNLTAEQQAELILAAEAVDERTVQRPVPVALDPACWARQAQQVQPSLDPNLPALGSIAWWYRKVLGSAVAKANNDRLAGWHLVDHHLALDEVPGTGQWLPRLLIYSTCTNLIRTLPEIMRSPTRPEDAATDGDDHAPDALRYLLQKLVGGGIVRVAPDVGGVRLGSEGYRRTALDETLDVRLAEPGPLTPGQLVRAHAVRQQPGRPAGVTDN